MWAGRRRIALVVAVVATLALVGVAVWGPVGPWSGSDGPDGPHQSAEEISELASLPEELTPLDPDNPNPTGDDPLAIGEPPELPRPASAQDFLARAERLRDSASGSTGSAGSAATSASTPAKVQPGALEPGPRADGDSLLVSFAPGTSREAIDAALAAAGLSGTAIDQTGVVEVDTAGHDQGEVTAALEDVDAVESVEPNLIRRIGRNPGDPELATQAPYLDTVHVPSAWDVADTGADVVVAVLDTGVDLDHPDLAPNLVAGYDAIDGGTPADDNGHGTQVAGIVGAGTDNGVGVAGVAWNAKVMPVKVLNAAGEGTDADIARGIIWATDHGARVVNMSLGGPGASTIIDNAVRYALQHEVVLVAAAGNDGSQVLEYPAAAPGVLGVTATDAAGRFAWFSNHGPWYYLAAPGIGIRSTALASGAAAAYTSDSGTSFSSPIVAGVAALVRERHPGWGWFEVADELVRTARDAGPAGLDDAYAFGIVDATAALGVSPLGAVSQPNRTGDAGNLRSAARAIAPGSTATETIGYEYDEDWFVFDTASEAGATITVTPPALGGVDPPRAAEMDPVVELYGPGGGLEAEVDDGLAGEGEHLEIEVAAGRHALRVRNYLGSASPAPYSVQVTLGAPLPPTAWAPNQIVFSVQSWAEAVAVADFSGDGRDDVAMATASYADPDNDFKLFVFTQGEDGSLGAPERLATHATHPADHDPLRAADFDGDGDIDLARGTATGLDVAWNDGSGLTEPVLYPAGGRIRWIQTADVDGSGPTELVVQDTNHPLRMLRWAGDDFEVQDLGFTATPGSPTGIGFAVTDITGDGRPDIAAYEATNVSIHAQQPDGTWAPPTTVELPSYGSAIERVLAVGDVSNDGRADIVTLGGADYPNSPKLVYRTQLPDGTFAPATTIVTDAGPGTAKIADVTGDGRNDVVVQRNGGSTAVFRQAPNGTLADGQSIGGFYASWEYSPDSMAIGDVDGDGINDVAVASYLSGLYVHRHQSVAATEGAGPWLSATSPAVHATGVATSVRPTVTFGRDVDSESVFSDTVFLVDGRNGAVVGSRLAVSGRSVTLTPNAALRPGVPYQLWIAGVTDPTSGERAYERIPFTTAPGPAPTYTVNRTLTPIKVDLDGNGYDDIFWYAPGDAADSIWAFGPDGRVGIPTSVRGTYTPIGGDFDGNGYDDIFWYAPGSGTDVMWWNSFDGITPAVVPVRGVYVPVAGDFDRNGYDDIFWYGPGTAPDSVWYFSPFGHTGVAQSVGGTYRPAAGDFTRDGYDDVVWYAPGAAAENLWRGSPLGFARGATMSITGTYRTRSLDRDGDGYDEVFLYTTNRGVFWRSGPTGFTSVQAGPPIASGGRPVAGDFTGDLRDDLFAYVPGTAPDPFYHGR